MSLESALFLSSVESLDLALADVQSAQDVEFSKKLVNGELNVSDYTRPSPANVDPSSRPSSKSSRGPNKGSGSSSRPESGAGGESFVRPRAQTGFADDNIRRTTSVPGESISTRRRVKTAPTPPDESTAGLPPTNQFPTDPNAVVNPVANEEFQSTLRELEEVSVTYRNMQLAVKRATSAKVKS